VGKPSRESTTTGAAALGVFVDGGGMVTITRHSALRAWTEIAAAITLVLTAASCSPGATTTVTDSGSPTATASAAGATTGPTPAPTVAPPPAHVYVFGDEWTTNPATDAQGSGCTPGAGSLPDGVWFGFVKTWSTTQVAFDMACWWTGAAGEAQAAAHGTEFTNDYFVTNDSTTIRLVTVAGDIPAKKAGWDDGIFTLSQVIADPGGSLPTSAPYPAWIYVNGGVVTELAVQYIP
jgi:hypothetical protein